jgi:hypothetical protein
MINHTVEDDVGSFDDKFAATLAATQSVMALYDQAKACADLHKKAGQPLPPPIQALVNAIVGTPAEQPAVRSKPKLKRRPIASPFPVLKDGWISVAAANAMPLTLVPTLLAHANEPLSPHTLVAQIREFGVEVSDGGLMNVGTRLSKERVIQYTTDGWRLRDATKVATMREGRLCGAPNFFQPPEVASYRREVILALLGAYGQLTRAEIIALLKETDWLHAPVMVTPIKLDLIWLSDHGLIRRSPGATEERTWTWELVAPAAKNQGKLRLA